jgi:hypothetical protein
MKLLGKLNELTRLLFNKTNGEDIELKPAGTGDSTGPKSINIPDGNTTTDTLVLALENQVLENKSISADDNTLSAIVDANIKAAAAIDATKISSGSINNTQFDKMVITDEVQTISNKTLVSPKIEDAGSNNTYTIVPADLMSGDREILLPHLLQDDTLVFQVFEQTLTNKTLTLPKLNEAVNLTATSTELNQLDGNTVGGATAGDIATIDAAQTLLNKTIDGDDNTVQDLSLTSLKTSGNTDVFVQRDNSGNVIDSTKAVPTGSVVGDSDTQTLTNKVLSSFKYDEASVALANSIAKNNATIMNLTGSPVDLQVMTGGADGDIKVLINDTGATFVLKENFGADGFYTGSGADLDLLDNATITVIYDAAESRWRVLGGSGGGAGGLTLTSVSSAITASKNIHYLVDSTGGSYNITLPAGSTGATIRFTDSEEDWHNNSVTLVPNGVETIDGQSSLELDVQSSWVQLMWDGTQWVSDDPFEPVTANLTGSIEALGHVKATEGFITEDVPNGNLVVDLGCTLTHPNLTISTGRTYTNNGTMHIAEDLIVEGDLIDNGTIINYSL